MSALTLANPIPSVSVLISEDGLERIDHVLHASGVISAIAEGDEFAFKSADAAYQALQATARDIEKAREALKAPILAFGRTLDATAKDAAAPLEAEKDRLGAIIKRWQVRENETRAEAARKAREEQARLQKIADDQAEAERLERIRLAEEERQRIIDATPKDDPVPGEDAVPVDEPPAVDHEVFVVPARTVIAPTAWVPPPVKSSVREKVDHIVVVVDKALVPIEVMGAELRPIDLAVAKRLMKTGIKIPGLRLDTITGTAPTGRG